MTDQSKSGPDASSRRRVVVAAGSRTPFTKAFEELRQLDTIGLAGAACRGLLERTKLDPRVIDDVVWGAVVFKTSAPNVARELVFDLNLPRSIPGMTMTQACLSGLRAITHSTAAIERGDAEVVLAGGSDSTSNAEVPLPTALVQALGKLTYGGKVTAGKLLGALSDIGSPRNLLPSAPKIAERSTGRTMGQHADDMVRQHGISREEQDAFALRSHRLAHAAQAEGRLDDEVCPVQVNGSRVERDTLVRTEIDPERVARLKPVFSRDGTITAASSSALTDGASAVLLMSEERARQLGFPSDVALVDWYYTALDPFDQLLLGPALAIPRLLDRHGLTMDDVDLFEIHEAFAGQVLCVLSALASYAFCRDRLGRSAPFGKIPDEKLNPNGGSVAIGHPFAATGGRLVASAANELRRRGGKHAVVALCAAGAMGGAALLTRD